MKKIFNADDLLQTDSIGDPQVSLQIQKSIIEYLHGAEQTKKGIENKFYDLKENALPGIIQSTFALWKDIDNNKKAKKLLEELIIYICASNPTARTFLVRVGIQQNPFQESREWLINCFVKISQNKITEEEKNMLENLDASVYDTSPELAEFIPLYLSYNLDIALDKGKKCIEQNLYKGNNAGLEKSISTLKMFKNTSDSIVQELVYLLFYKIKKDGRLPIKEFCSIIKSNPFAFNKNNYKGFLEGLNKTLQQSNHPRKRETYVEHFFNNSYRLSFNNDNSLLKLIDENIEQYEYLIQYWFQATLGNSKYWNNNNVEKYFINRNYNECSSKYILAFYVQYFFQKIKIRTRIENTWIHTLARELAKEYQTEYSQAECEVESIGLRTIGENYENHDFNTSGGLR